MLLIILILFSLALLVDWLAPKIPFSVERSVTEQVTPWVELEQTSTTQIYLQKLANDLAKAQDLPPEMTITVHYINDDTVNAFATLGGHIILLRGLLEKLPNENAVAMVLAHEIAHIKHRHPIKGLGRAAVFTLAVAMVSGATGSDIAGQILGEAGLLTALKFSRSQEQQADDTALTTLARYYGHVNGANDLFQVFDALQSTQGIETPALFSSHPHTNNRIQQVHDLAQQQGWSLDAPLTSLPHDFNHWLNASERKEPP